MASVDEILKGKYPAKEHAKRVTEWIVSKGGSKDGILYLEAQKQKYNEVSTQIEVYVLKRVDRRFFLDRVSTDAGSRTMIKSRTFDNGDTFSTFQDVKRQTAMLHTT